MADLRDRPVFICGHPKSGTSLLRALLDGHPQLLVYPEETVFFRRYLPEAQGCTLEQRLRIAEQRLIHIFTWNQADPPPSQAGFPDRDYSSVSFEAVKAALERIVRAGLRHDGDMLSAAMLTFGEATGQNLAEKRGWVEKTPFNERYARQIYTWWPEARCLHLLRDPRDNYASYQRKHPDWTPEIFAFSWEDSTRLGEENQRRYGASRYWLRRYEDLVQDPEKFLTEMCAFLGIDDDPVLRVPTRNGVDWEGNSMFHERFQGISGAAIDRWRKTLSETETQKIVAITRNAMQQYGYPLQPVSLAIRLRAQALKVRRRFSGSSKKLL
jgi:hypothetical protein